jgi:hypothetical protein
MFFKKTKNSLVAVVLTSLVAFFPGASIAQAAVTQLSFVINPYKGGLAISSPGGANFPTIDTPETDTSVSLTLETVTVTDTRRSLSALGVWTTTAQASNLVSATDTLTASTFGYVSGANVKTGGLAFVTAQTRTSLDSPVMVQQATGITGNHVVTWYPTLSVPVIGNKTPGTYIGSITHSVS